MTRYVTHQTRQYRIKHLAQLDLHTRTKGVTLRERVAYLRVCTAHGTGFDLGGTRAFPAIRPLVEDEATSPSIARAATSTSSRSTDTRVDKCLQWSWFTSVEESTNVRTSSSCVRRKTECSIKGMCACCAVYFICFISWIAGALPSLRGEANALHDTYFEYL